MSKRCVMALLLAASGLAMANEPVDLDMVSRIRQEAFHNSQVMATMKVPELTERLQEIKAPVLGFWGLNERMMPESGASSQPPVERATAAITC